MISLTVDQVEDALGRPLDDYAHQCHVASLTLVRSGLLPQSARVARGTCRGVLGQHSWVTLGNPYDPDVVVVDVTAWSYSTRYPRVWITRGQTFHTPHGAGSIWAWGVPVCGDGETVELAPDPAVEISFAARQFLTMVAKSNDRDGLDRRGWANLANAPVEGWPAAEVIEAMLDTPELAALVPVDRAGMLTDRNPDGLYW